MSSLIFILFFFSGMCGLVYEVVWTRMLTLVMGNTVYAGATVLASLMGGLALGSLLFGRIVDRASKLLLLYGALEFLLGAYCLAFPLLMDGSVPLYRFLYTSFEGSADLLTLVRFLFSSLLIVIPGALMGGTLPVLGKYLVQGQDQMGSSAGRLYAANSIGAGVGAVTTGFLLIPALGVSASLQGAAFMNLLIGCVAFLLSPFVPLRIKVKSEYLTPDEVTPEGGREARWVVIAFAVSGFAALIYEVAWTRSLSLLLGSSVQAFSLLLGAFIAGLAIGSFLFSRAADRKRDLLLLFGLLQLGVAFSSVAFVPVIGSLPPLIRVMLRHFQGTYGLIQIMNGGLIFIIMLVPTTCLGALFPIAVKITARSIPALGSQLGRLYAGNTLGAVAGSLAAGFLLVPSLGLQKTILIASLVSGSMGGGLLFYASGLGRFPARRFLAVVPVLMLFLAVWNIPRWDANALSSGPYLYLYKDATSARKILSDDKLLYYREGVTGTVAVKQRGDNRFLAVSGKIDASTGPDMATQILLGHIPLFLAHDPRDVLVIGLASGVTAGSVARYPVKTIDVVEISREVFDAVPLFSEVNHDLLKDDRVNVLIRDGRNHLLLDRRSYDVIISEPSNPWMAGIGNLYTREFFELARSRLRPGGIMAQWIGVLYGVPNPILKSIIRTYAEVFPHVGLWVTMPGDLLLVGSDSPLTIDVEKVKKTLAQERVQADLLRVAVDNWQEVIRRAVAEGDILKGAIKEAPVHTDDHPFLEFDLPKSLHVETWRENAAWIAGLMKQGSAPSTARGSILVSKKDEEALASAQAEVRAVFEPSLPR